jgi:hypothetical protein
MPHAPLSLYSSCHSGLRQPTLKAFMSTVQDLFKTCQTYIILDALDECAERTELLQDIEQILEWRTTKLHILATSRDISNIGEFLGTFLPKSAQICIQNDAVNEDIRAYVHERIYNDRRLKRWQKQPQVQLEIENSLMEKSCGM